MAEFARKERCVDDTIHFDTDLKTHWWRTIDFLIKVGSSGIVLNPEKLQFSMRSVEFAGFKISCTSIEPLPKYIDAIRHFPTPKSCTDIRSWYGLINQVSNYAQLRDSLAPFRHFLKHKVRFEWSAELNVAFESSKQSIIESIKHGVKIFDLNRPTCLRPDWSCRGIGYFLLQKHCKCTSSLPDCCPTGWKVTLAGSRFLRKHELRYVAIEGEALAITWALQQTRYFTQGCDNLLVVTDHKPLVKIFGDRQLDEIDNTRLFRLKQKALPWHFKVAYLPGKTNCAADATSRHPSHIDTSDFPASTYSLAAVINNGDKTKHIPWNLIVEATSTDPVLTELKHAIESGFVGKHTNLQSFWQYRSDLHAHEGVILYQDRVIIPTTLRKTALKLLHSAHQGVAAMSAHARSLMFWPGITKDIENTRAKCSNCNLNAPSQPHMPSDPDKPPVTPFEQVYADFFEYGGRNYLI